jgi:caffeic acid 3-O-methyltransferase
LNPVSYATWLNLHEVILDERCERFHKAHGLPLQEYISQKHSDYRAQLEGSCVSYKRWLYKGLFDGLRQYGVLNGVSTLIEFGGSEGTMMSEIVAQDPQIKVVTFDLTDVIAEAPSLKGMLLSPLHMKTLLNTTLEE